MYDASSEARNSTALATSSTSPVRPSGTARNIFARTVGSAVTVPANLAVPNSYLLLGETSYSYRPSYGYVVTGTMTLSDQIYMHPRQSNSVTRNNS